MEKKRIIVFIVHTEYHFMQALNIAMSSFNNAIYENHIHITKRRNRFENIIFPELDKNIFIRLYVDKKPSEYVNEVLELSSCYRYFFFQENSIHNRFLGYRLKRKCNTIVSLGPDGYKPYAIYNKKHEFLSMLKDTVKDNIELYRDGFRTLKFFKSDYYRYGSSSYIDEVWLTDVESFNPKWNKTKAKLKKITPFTVNTISDIKRYFKQIPNVLDGEEKIILYLNQPFWTEDLIRNEMKFLNDLVKHFKNKVYLKPHPGTPKETMNKYAKIKNIKIIDSKLPAELFILNIENSIIFSGWSTALITNNTSCNYYFNLPIYKNCGAKAVDQSELTILEHINVIERPEQMNFPNA